MTIHMGDDFSRRDASFDGAWRPETPQTPRHGPGRNSGKGPQGHTGIQGHTCNLDAAAADSTNMDMLEHGLIQPGDL